ncbi:MAG: carbohydrate binding domain-containing protein [Candidatus Omnitrophota bacterium]
MKVKLIILISIAAVIMIRDNGHISAYQPLADAVAIKSEGTVSATPGPMLDDFNSGSSVNLWGNISGTLAKSDTTASIVGSYVGDTAAYGNAGHSLQLTYDVNYTDSWATYYTSLGGDSISDYNYLSFWVKGLNGGEYFKIELHHTNFDPTQSVGHNNDYNASVYVTDYLDGGVATAWRKVVIPLDAFANITDRSRIKEIAITFENTQAALNGSPKNSTVYIDNICFGKQFLGFVRIDHFGDKVSKNALGGNCGGASETSPVHGSFSYTNSQYVDYANGLDFHFQDCWDTDTPADHRYYAYASVVGGGDSGSTPQPRNFSAYSNITFSCKSSSANVRCLKMELHCPTYLNNYFHFFKYTFTNTSWTKVTVPLSEFTTKGWAGQGTSITAVNKTNSIGEIVFTRDGWMSRWPGDWDYGVFAGDFYIDEVQFEADGYAPDTTAPAKPGNLAVSGSGNQLTVACTASSRISDATMENVGFEYEDGAIWRAIGCDYNTAGNSYSTTWDVSGLSAGSYKVRAAAMDAAGNVTYSNNVVYKKS